MVVILSISRKGTEKDCPLGKILLFKMGLIQDMSQHLNIHSHLQDTEESCGKNVLLDYCLSCPI